MKHEVIIPKRVQKQLDKIDIKYKPRVISVIMSLSENPFMGKKLSGKFKDQRSCDVWPYRILYEIKKYELVILIVKVGHRQGIYNG